MSVGRLVSIVNVPGLPNGILARGGLLKGLQHICILLLNLRKAVQRFLR